jgi:NADH-ubiquinone oxidoreductase chain 4
MLLSCLIITPILSAIVIANLKTFDELNLSVIKFNIKEIALSTTVLNFLLSLFILIFFNNSTNQFQYVQEHYNVQFFDIYLGVDGISIYFILLTTLIMPIALLSN